MLDQNTINSFSARAKAKGYTDAQIQAEILRKKQEAQAATQPATPTAPSGGMDMTNPGFASDQPAPENKPSILSSIFHGIADPFIRTLGNIGTAAITIPQMQEAVAFQKIASNPKANALYQKLGINASDVSSKIGNADILGTRKRAEEIANNPKESLKKQLLDSLNVASYAIPFGKGANIATKAILPGAAVGGIQEATTNDKADINSVAKAAVMGAGTAGVLEGAGKVIKGALKLGGVGSEKVGQSLATKSLRPSPSQMYNFSKDTGEKIPEFLKSRGLQGANFDKITNYIDPIQKSFDTAVSDSKLKIDPSTIIDSFSNEITSLKNSILPADQAKAKVLQDIALNFIDKFGGDSITAKTLTELRRQVDTGIKDFALDAAIKTPLQTTRDVLQNTIRDAANGAGVKVGEQSVKDAGVELSKLYKLRDIAEKTQYKGKGSLPIGLMQLLGGGVGGAVGGLPGAALGAIGAEVASKPGVIGAASKVASKVGEVAGKVANKVPGLNTPFGQMFSRIPSISGEQNNTKNNNTSDNSSNHLVSPSLPFGQGQDNKSITQKPQTITGHTVEDHMRALSAAKAAGDTAGAKAIQAQLDIETAYNKTLPSNKPLAAVTQNQVNLATAGLKGWKDALDMYTKDPNIIYKGALTAGLASRKFEAAVDRAIEGILRARSGAAVPDSEVRKYRAVYAPRLGDTKEVGLYKLQALQQDLQGIIDGSTNISPLEGVLGGFSQ